MGAGAVPSQTLLKSEWSVVDCSQAEARSIIEREHYSRSCPNTSVARHALRSTDGDLVGVALWLPPTKNAASSVAGERWRGVLSLSRLCVSPGVPGNAASYLLGRSMRLLDRTTWHTLLTYADTREGHTGAIYRATNWTCLGEVPGSDAWIHSVTGERRGRKRGKWNHSTAEMTELGFVRLPTMPKIKFVHILDRVRCLP